MTARPIEAGVNQIIDRTHHLSPYAQNGRWNDPDMLVVTLNVWMGPGYASEGRVPHPFQSTVPWAPLWIGCEMRSMSEATRAIWLNEELIQVNQDRRDRAGWTEAEACIWAKPLTGDGWAIGRHNRSAVGSKEIMIRWADVGVSERHPFLVRSLRWR